MVLAKPCNFKRFEQWRATCINAQSAHSSLQIGIKWALTLQVLFTMFCAVQDFKVLELMLHLASECPASNHWVGINLLLADFRKVNFSSLDGYACRGDPYNPLLSEFLQRKLREFFQFYEFFWIYLGHLVFE